MSTGEPSFTCPHYRALPGTKRCRAYMDDGACTRPDEFMCTEWLRANGYGQRPSQTVTGSQGTAPDSGAAPPPTPAALTPRDVTRLAALGEAACVPLAGDRVLWLVPAYTSTGRQELTFEDAATVAGLCVALPNTVSRG